MVTITNEMMQERLAQTRAYSLVILKEGPNYRQPGADKIIWEHGRRNFALRQDGALAIVCPVRDDSEVCGIGIFDADPDATTRLMAEDPAVLAGVLIFEVHPVRGFPGDALPA
jgi:hypothetical protein